MVTLAVPSVVVEPGPSPEFEQDLLYQRARQDCVDKIAQWLRRGDRASVMSISCFGDRIQSGRPDRAYDAVALESDLDAAIGALPSLEQAACVFSREASRDSLGWFRNVDRLLRAAVGPQWIHWMDQIEEEHGRGARPFEKLLDKSAGMIADHLGSGWWT